MTHLYIKLCDLCGKPCEVDSGLHGGNIKTDIMINKGRVSYKVFAEEFDVCITCLENTGLLDMLERFKLIKEENSKKKISFKKLLIGQKMINK